MPRLTPENEKWIRANWQGTGEDRDQLLDEIDALRAENERLLNLRLPRPSQLRSENAQLRAERDQAKTHYGDALFEIGVLKGQLKAEKQTIIDAIIAIDWAQQDSSRYYIGEDGAEALLSGLNFDWNEGLCNESVERHVAKIRGEEIVRLKDGSTIHFDKEPSDDPYRGEKTDSCL